MIRLKKILFPIKNPLSSHQFRILNYSLKSKTMTLNNNQKVHKLKKNNKKRKFSLIQDQVHMIARKFSLQLLVLIINLKKIGERKKI